MSADTPFQKSAVRIYYSLGALHYLLEFASHAGLAGIFSAVISLARGKHSFAVPLLVISMVALVVGIIFKLRAETYRLQGPNPGLKIETLKITYCLLGNSKYREIREVSAKAVVDGVDHYKHKFAWSGGGSLSPRIELPEGGRVELATEPLSTLRVCKSFFDRPLRKSERILTRTIIDLDDTAATAKPFLALTVNDWVRRTLILQVRFSRNIPSRIKLGTFISSVSEIPIEERTETLARGEKEYVWTIHHPRPYYKYLLSW